MALHSNTSCYGIAAMHFEAQRKKDNFVSVPRPPVANSRSVLGPARGLRVTSSGRSSSSRTKLRERMAIKSSDRAEAAPEAVVPVEETVVSGPNGSPITTASKPSDDLASDILKFGSTEEALRELDVKLGAGDDKAALEIVRGLQGQAGGLRGFGAAAQVPQRQYTLQDLRLNKIDTAKFLSPQDTTLGSIRQGLQIAALAGLGSAWFGLHLDQMQLLGIVIFALFIGTTDQIVNGGGVEALLVDTLGNAISPTYRGRVAQHEAGHFLVSYLLGILPRGYTLSSLDAYQRYGAFNIQAGTTFVDLDFQAEVKSGKVSSGMLDRFSCVALAGVATEYLKYELAEGGVADVQQLDALFKGLGFSQKKADSQVRWAVLNTVTLLRRHEKAHDMLATAMRRGASVGQCISVIEEQIKDMQDV